MAASNSNTSDINPSHSIDGRKRSSTGMLRLPATSRDALVINSGPPRLPRPPAPLHREVSAARYGPLLPPSYDHHHNRHGSSGPPVVSSSQYGPAVTSNLTDSPHTQRVKPTTPVKPKPPLQRPAVNLYFDRNELQQMGALELPVANCSLLKNKIHPIFGRQNFENTWHNIWPHVQQILRLASRFLDDEAILPFWHALIFDRRLMLDCAPIDGYYLEQFSIEAPLNTEQMERTRIYLQHYGALGGLKISFYTDPSLVCHAYCSRDNSRPLTKHTYPGTNSFINVDDRYREVLDLHVTGKRSMTDSQLLRFQFTVAKTLVHEVAHAIFRALNMSPVEPYCNDQIVSEIGRAWEVWTFGCLPTTALNLRDCSYGLVGIAPWPDNFETERNLNPSGPRRPLLGPLHEGRTSYALQMEWVQKVQTEEFWNIEVKHRGVDALEIPLKLGVKRYDPKTVDSDWVRGRDAGKRGVAWSQWQAEGSSTGYGHDPNMPQPSLSSGCVEFDV